MLDKIQTTLQILFPPRCVGCGDLVESDFGLCGSCWRETPFAGGLVCEKCGVPVHGEEKQAPVLCDDCMRYERPWSKGRTALLYRDNGRKLVLAIKHGDRYDIVRPAARWLALAAKPLLELPDGESLIAPVPLHRVRLFKRKYNQSALLAKALAANLNLPFCLDLLERPSARGSMRGLDHAERFMKMQGAMTVNPARKEQVKDKTVLIVDDVMTSGATLSAATLAAFGAGALDVRIVTLARVAKSD
ncbi:MAG: ComF family protein [Rhodobacteraceae bacterium]|nr:ComF family protein [Paracoccaceae bacterium]